MKVAEKVSSVWEKAADIEILSETEPSVKVATVEVNMGMDSPVVIGEVAALSPAEWQEVNDLLPLAIDRARAALERARQEKDQQIRKAAHAIMREQGKEAIEEAKKTAAIWPEDLIDTILLMRKGG